MKKLLITNIQILLLVEFIQEEIFRTIIYRPRAGELTPQVQGNYRRTTVELPQEFSSTSVGVRNLIKVLENEMNRQELQEKLGLRHEGNFRENYLEPSLNQGLIIMKYPETPNHPDQRYKLSALGVKLKKHFVNDVGHEITMQDTPHDTPQDTMQVNRTEELPLELREQVKEQVGEQVKEQVKEVVTVIIDEMSVQEIMWSLHLKGRRNFLQNYLQPALEMEFIEMTQPKSPNSPTQKYRLTTKGATLKEFLKTKK